MTILQARRYQKKDADLDAVAASGVASAWTAYTPTVTAGSGTFTTVSAIGRYLTIGKLTFVLIKVTITTNGTAAGNVSATLPNTANTTLAAIFTGRESGLTGNMLQGPITATTTVILDYKNAYPGGSGAVLNMAGFYEVA